MQIHGQVLPSHYYILGAFAVLRISQVEARSRLNSEVRPSWSVELRKNAERSNPENKPNQKRRGRKSGRPEGWQSRESESEDQEERQEAEEESNRLSTQAAYQLTFSEADTEVGEDVHEADGDEGRPQLEWDFVAFRRRSSAISSREESMMTLGTGYIGTRGSCGITAGGDNELRDHVELSFSGAALKWYTYKEAVGQLSGEWRDQGGLPVVPGVRAQILAQFTLVNRMQFNEAKLRERKQGMEERTIEYYYDVLDLCRRVNPNMGEAVKLGHLWRGLKPSVLEKLWSLKPGTCEEFLQEYIFSSKKNWGTTLEGTEL
ncbi:Uncharacterized protein APZ42_013914 [Daphnia magna]|uniref:Retrotransposon gag domain-containing protein n=1 Tax=Daphnia magna TaxID=35525 RepID=A0A162QDK9_9CRUS|nr:Uncharacterized protein APZ42_013914 [Daphnia magna]